MFDQSLDMVEPPSSCVSGMYAEEVGSMARQSEVQDDDSRRGKKLYWPRYDFNGRLGWEIITESIIWNRFLHISADRQSAKPPLDG